MNSRSRLLARLDAAIAAAANPIEAQCLRAERAGLLARQGQLEAAQAVIDELKTQLAWQPTPRCAGGWRWPKACTATTVRSAAVRRRASNKRTCWPRAPQR